MSRDGQDLPIQNTDHHQAEPSDTFEYPADEISRSSTHQRRSIHTRIGDYDVLGEIGRGGMGIVLKAKHRQLGRLAALKLIKSEIDADSNQTKRFLAEASAASKLDHPNIVSVFEIGEHDGQPFMALAFVDGTNLWDHLRRSPWDSRIAAQIMKTVAQAIQYAHDRGIVHRDIKPQNILITQSGVPRITDFGLAKESRTDSGLTGTGEILGTPSYMSPEQASSQLGKIGPQSDVYSLGATLYALLTARPPFQASNALATIQQVLDEDPISPRALNPNVPRDLDTICLKCLHKRPQDRYPSAKHFAEDLERYLSDLPILARPVGSVEKNMKWIRRNPLLTGLAITCLVAALSIVAVSILRYYQSELSDLNSELRQSLEEGERAMAAENEYKHQALAAFEKVEHFLYANRISLAAQEIKNRNFGLANRLLEECRYDIRGWEWFHLRTQSAPANTVEPMMPSGLTQIACSRVSDRIAYGDMFGNVMLLDPRSKRRIELPKHDGSVRGLSFGNDGDHVFVGTESGEVVAWQLKATSESIGLSGSTSLPVKRYTKQLRSRLSALHVTSDSHYLVAITRESDSTNSEASIHFWNALDGTNERILTPLARSLGTLAVTNKWAACSTQDNRIHVQDLSSGSEEIATLPFDGIPVAFAFSADANMLFVAIEINKNQFELKAMRTIDWTEFSSHTESWQNITQLFCGKNDSELYVVGDGQISQFDFRSWNQSVLYSGHPPVVHAVYHQSDEQVMAIVGRTNQPHAITSWNSVMHSIRKSIGASSTRWTHLLLNSDGSRLWTSEESGPVRLWDTEKAKSLLTLDSVSASAIAVSNKEKRIATASGNHALIIWSGTTGKMISNCGTRLHPVRKLCFSLDDQYLASLEKEITLFTMSGEPKTTIPGEAIDLAFQGEQGLSSPVLVVLRNDRIEWIDIDSLRTISEHRMTANRMCTDASGEVIHVVLNDGTVRKVDRRSGLSTDVLFEFPMITSEWTSDIHGERIGILARKGIDLWDTRSGLKIGTFLESDRYVQLGISNTTLVASNVEGQLFVWKYK